ncbi:MAG: aminoglycoside phosphotransferase family protein [Rhodospirillales bacterium]|nr:aminoglycoside phosphotransferase family protein [Rhodospirillales bacterium]
MADRRNKGHSGGGQAEDDIRAAGEALAGMTVNRVTAARAGGNNRIFRLDCIDATYALKFYPPQADDRRDRLGAEYAALSFLCANGIDRVPRPFGVDRERHCALYEWIDGDPVTAREDTDVDAMIGFLIDIQGLREVPEAAQIKRASAGCLSPDAAIRQFRARLERFLEVAPEFPELERFLVDRLAPRAEALNARLLGELSTSGIDPDRQIPQSSRALSPSDFGFHNALRRRDGRLVFIDFEYFGWDDPGKMIADVMLHPGMNLSAAERERVSSGLTPFFGGRDDGFNRRFRLFLPLCALIWCLILVNEYLPERWTRRNLSGRLGNAAAARERQLAKAQRMLDWIEKEFV